MQDAFAYCAELVRTADRDRFLSSLFAPAEHRGALHALYAFNVEVARVREVAREPLPGEIRLQWWSEVLRGERAGEASANPVASALLTVIERYRLESTGLTALIDARCFDLYDDPMARLADLEAYARKTSSALIALAAQILGSADAEVTETVATPAGIAYAIAGLIRAFPLHAARRQLYVPLEVLERHGVEPQDIFAGKSSENLRAAFADLRRSPAAIFSRLTNRSRRCPLPLCRLFSRSRWCGRRSTAWRAAIHLRPPNCRRGGGNG